MDYIIATLVFIIVIGTANIMLLHAQVSKLQEESREFRNYPLDNCKFGSLKEKLVQIFPWHKLYTDAEFRNAVMVAVETHEEIMEKQRDLDRGKELVKLEKEKLSEKSLG